MTLTKQVKISIGVGLVAMVLLYGVSMLDQRLAGTIFSCLGVRNKYKPASFYQGLPPGMSHTLCLLTSFFVMSMETYGGKVFVFYIANAMFCHIVLFMAIESTRTGAKYFVAWFALSICILQLSGMAIIFPLVWMSTFYKYAVTPGSGLSHSKVYLVLASILAMETFTGFMTKTDAPWYPLYQFIWNMLLPVVVLPWKLDFIVKKCIPQVSIQSLPVFGSVRGLKPGTVAAVISYYIFAVIGLFYHLQFVYKCFQNTDQTFWFYWKAVQRPDQNGAIFFLVADFVMVVVSTAVLILSEKIVQTSVVTYVTKSIIFGPAATFSWFCASREKAADLKSSKKN